MPLHPVIAAALAAGAHLPAYRDIPLAQARDLAMLPYRGKRTLVAVGAVHNLAVPGPAGPVPLRIYQPLGEGPYPVVVFFHGSGFVVLGLDSHDNLCRQLCVGARCVVVSVDYRLAPEHKFPAAPDDCLAATRWVARHIGRFGGDPRRLGLAGDSAGGCLAAVTSARLRDEAQAGDPVPCCQLLFYPVTDHPSPAPASYTQYGVGYGLTDDGMRWFWDQYLPSPDDAAHPHASPLRAASVAGLPPTYVVVAEYDVLRDEGEAYAQRLAVSGIPVVSRRATGMNHGFLKYAGAIGAADTEIGRACGWLCATLRAAPARSADARPALA